MRVGTTIAITIAVLTSTVQGRKVPFDASRTTLQTPLVELRGGVFAPRQKQTTQKPAPREKSDEDEAASSSSASTYRQASRLIGFLFGFLAAEGMQSGKIEVVCPIAILVLGIHFMKIAETKFYNVPEQDFYPFNIGFCGGVFSSLLLIISPKVIFLILAFGLVALVDLSQDLPEDLSELT